MSARKATSHNNTSGSGEGHEGETPQVSNRYSRVFRAAQGIWVKLATAQSTFRFLDKAQSLGINTNDVNNFLSNQEKIQKVMTNAKQNTTLCRKHTQISSNLMSLKVSDQALVLEEARNTAMRASDDLRNTAPSSKSFRNAIHQLNSISRDVTENLEYKNSKKLDHLQNKQKHNVNGEISIRTSTRHRFESVYPNLSTESTADDMATEEEMNQIRSKEKPIIDGNIEADDDEKDVLTMNPKKPIQMEPKLSDFQIEMESCFCKTRWSIVNSEKYNTGHLEGIPWEALKELDKQKFIKREAEMRRIFSREHKCIRMNNLQVTDSRFNAHIT